jgi:ankyrin repeat protein
MQEMKIKSAAARVSGSGSGFTPPQPQPPQYDVIYMVCLGGHHEELQEILLQQEQSGLDVDWAGPETGATAAYIAAAEGHDNCLSLLGQHGADLSKPKSSGWAPIHTACQYGRYACLTPLLEHRKKKMRRSSSSRAGEVPTLV